MTTPTNEVRKAAYKAMDAYLDAGGSYDLIVISRAYLERNTRQQVIAALEKLELPREKHEDQNSDEYEYNLGYNLGYNHALSEVRAIINSAIEEYKK